MDDYVYFTERNKHSKYYHMQMIPPDGLWGIYNIFTPKMVVCIHWNYV